MAQEQPRGTTPHPRSRATAERSHPKSEARGGGREEQPEERRSYPTLKVRNVVVRRYLSSKVRRSGCALLAQLWRDTPCHGKKPK